VEVIAIAITSGASVFHVFGHDVGHNLWHSDRQHFGPPGYYLLSAIVTFWPGTLAALVAVALATRSHKNFAARFCLAWLVPSWTIVELIPSKLPHNVLPMFPALAILTANAALSPTCDRKRSMRTLLGWIAGGSWIFATLASGAACSAMPILLGSRPGAVVIYPIVFGAVLPGLDELWLSQYVRDALAGDTAIANQPFITVGYYDPSLPFLLDRQVVLLDPESAAAYQRTHCDAILLTSRERDHTRRGAGGNRAAGKSGRSTVTTTPRASAGILC
jgi:4-amino-4-deoxy-L-arabinose transferase-like glycosyltransferase